MIIGKDICPICNNYNLILDINIPIIKCINEDHKPYRVIFENNNIIRASFSFDKNIISNQIELMVIRNYNTYFIKNYIINVYFEENPYLTINQGSSIIKYNSSIQLPLSFEQIKSIVQRYNDLQLFI